MLHIDAGGRRREVEVVRVGDTCLVSIDGRDVEVDVKDIDGTLSLLIGTKSYEISVGPPADGTVMVHVDGVPVEVTVSPSGSVAAAPRSAGAGSVRPATGRAAAGASGAGGPQQVKAPMPGKIVKLLVKPGDRVEPRQGLVVIEAMKMENELRAKAAGTVVEVRAVEGASVEAGAILVILE
ncbi:MAG TPA: biotin/lipoyl-containing protein [Vicinamibacterales bacterium]|nr:biotin/lipoyl-containing protein [Vicinamibacterales bacterium]